MEELLKTSFGTYLGITMFLGFIGVLLVYGAIENTKEMENKKIKFALRIAICSVIVCLWMCFVYMQLYPISLAYYEYNHDIVEEKIGVINSIEQDGKDRMNLIIDDAEYTMVYSSVTPAVIIGSDIDEGDTIKIKFGEKSMYIFEISAIPSLTD